jgi:hypothetical protein
MKHHFREMRQPSAMSADATIAAQLLGNGGKIEPYTIIIMVSKSSFDLINTYYFQFP